MTFLTRGKRRRGNRANLQSHLQSRRQLFSETLEGRWMLDATIISDTNLYPPQSPAPANTVLANVPFNESETIAAGTFPAVGATVNLQTGTLGVFYTDETALLLGVTQTVVNTAGGTQTFTGQVSPLPSSPSSVINPLVGVGGSGASSSYDYIPPTSPFNTLPIQPGTDSSGRPVFPSLYVTDITGLTPSTLQYYNGDWQFGGTPVAPNAVFGAWKSATQTIDETGSTPTVSFSVGANPAKNGWDLGPGADPAPTGFQNQGYGAEAQWNLSALNLNPGHSYRFYFIVHDGDQNKTGGDVGQAAFDLVAPVTPTVNTTTGGTVVFGSGTHLSDSATLSGGSNPTGTITFNLYSPTDTTFSSPVYTTTVPVSGNGTYSINSAGSTNPGGFLPTVMGTYEWVATYSGDKNNSPATSGNGNEPDSVVNANISISPLTPVNEVNHAETFTITETASPAGAGAPTFGTPVVSFPGSTPATVTSLSGPTINGNTATFNVSINNPTSGTFDVKATGTITVGGVAITRSTGDGLAGDSPDAVKNYVDAKITITPPNPVNEINHAETFTITVTASPAGTGTPSFATPVVSFPGSTPGTVGPVTLVGINGNVATYTETINSAVTGTFEVKASDTVTMGGVIVTRTTGDGISGDSADAVKTYVNAGITITPPNPVNEVNHQETFTITETASPVAGQAPTFGTPVISFPGATPVTVSGVSGPVVNGNSATFTVSINNPTSGTFEVRATGVITIGGVAVTRSTGDGLPGDSPDAVKNYVDANIQISPLNPINPINSPETFTIIVTAIPAATGTPTFGTPTVSFPVGTPGTVGPVTLVSINGDVATYTETINSPVPGVFEVKASDTVTMGGVTVTRTTGDGLSGDSIDAVKNYVSAGISITPPNPVNEVNHQETFTVTETATPVAGQTPVFGTPVISFPAGTPVTVSGVSGPVINGNTASFTVSINNPTSGTFDVKATGMITIGGVTVTRSTGDGLPGDSPDAVKNYVDAKIAITPPNPVNEVTHQETFTITVTASPAATGTPTFGTPTVSFPGATPGTVGSVSAPTINGNVATYTVSINNPTAGTFEVKASDTVTMGGVTVTRTTGDGISGDSADAVKNYVDANIKISPLNPVNQLNQPETFTITVTAIPAATGTPTFGLPVVTFPGATPGTVGPVTPVSTVGNVATYTETINSAVTGTFEVKVSDTVTMGGVTVTRTTGDGLPGDSPDAIKTYIKPPTPTINTVPGGILVLGSGRPLSDSAVVSGGNNPTGTVTFFLFAPGVTPNANDSNAVYSEVAPLVGGSAHTGTGTSTGSAVPTAFGTYEWVAVYSGDANNQSVSSPFTSEPQVVGPPLAISTFAGPDVVLGSGAKLNDSAVLENGQNPTGTLTFYLFAPGVTPNALLTNNVYSDTVTVNGGGPFDTSMGTNPGGFLPTVVGTYQWVAVYSGDANNPPAASQFTSEPENVTQSNTQVVIFKIADAQQINAGDTAGFTIKIQNTGANTAQGLTLTDPLPAGVASDINWQVDTSGTGFGAGTTPADFTITGAAGHQTLSLISSVTTLPAGASLSVHITGQTSLNDVDPNLPPCSSTLVNTATVNAVNEPANEQNAQAKATITLHNVDVDISKTADQQQVIAGQQAGYVIQIYNQGCVTAAGITLDDLLPEGPLNDIFWRIDPNTLSPELFQITGSIGNQHLSLAPGVTTLAPNALMSVHVIGQTTINDVGTLNNTATVNASNEPSFEDNAQATADITVIPGTPNSFFLYVQSAYQQILGRNVDSATEASIVNQLASGSLTKIAFAEGLTHSTEYFDNVVTRAYEHFLGRSPDASGLFFWAQALSQGMTDEQLESFFIGSTEYYQHSGGTDKAWVDHMYFDLLGRAPDAAGEAFWVNALAAGASRSSVALGFAGSAEREGMHVVEDYETYLGRIPGGSEVASWVNAFEHGLRNEDVIAGFVASDEYFRQHG